jgi:hypothetical protein
MRGQSAAGGRFSMPLATPVTTGYNGSRRGGQGIEHWRIGMRVPMAGHTVPAIPEAAIPGGNPAVSGPFTE